ncbi:MAG: TolC family protein [Elusimicrobiota bacterium]|nr:TolC family protein [Elusimicrobiota bacterium]
MKKILLCLFLVFTATVGVFAVQPITLRQALGYALRHNGNVESAREEYRSSAYDSKATIGTFLPRIDISGGYVKLNDPITMDLNNIRSAIIEASGAAYFGAGGTNPAFTQSLGASMPSFEKTMLDENLTRVFITVVQPIFTGFKISANSKVKGLQKDASRLAYQNTRNKMISSVIEDYYRVKLVEQSIQIKKNYKEDIDQHLDNAKKMYNSGLVSKVQVLKAMTAAANAESDYKSSLSDKETAVSILGADLGADASNLELTDPLTMLSGFQDLDYYLLRAQDNNDLALLNIKKAGLEQKHKVSVGNTFPTISAMGQYQLLQDDLSDLEPEWFIGITASLNIFAGGQDYYKIQSSKAQLNSIDGQIDGAKRMLNAAVAKYFYECQSAQDRYEALKVSIAYAKESVRLARAAFRARTGTSLEVIDAQMVLEKAQIDQAKAIFDFNSAFANLLHLCNLSEVSFRQQ